MDGLEGKVPYGLILVQFSTQWSWKEMVLKEVAMYKIVDNFSSLDLDLAEILTQYGCL